MSELRYDLAYLTNPRIFAKGRMPAVSDHDTFLNTIEAEANASSLHRTLNGLWKFHYAKCISKRPKGFEAADYDCENWSDIRVPGHIQMQGYGHPQYVNTQYPWDGHEEILPPAIPTEFNPVGSYVRYFEVPKAWDNSRVVISFQGVETAFFCWVNGKLIGYAEDSFTPSHFDITSALQEGQNKLAVEVFRFSSASWIEDQDFWRFSGIFRDVVLSAQPKAHVSDIFVHPELDDDFINGTLKAEVSIELPDKAVTLVSELIDKKGNIIDHFETAASSELLIERPIQRPLHWSAEDPNLYTLRLTLKDAAEHELEVVQTKLGFRRVEMKDGLMLLNGKRISFHGVNRHEFCIEGGRSVSARHMIADIRTIKRNNLNAVRTSHYPNNSLWYRLCDEYGVYLIDEANLESHGTWQLMGSINDSHTVPNNNPDWTDALIDRATSMQERDKNHPAILIWSCGNESYGGKCIFDMSEHMRKRDPSRLVHYEGVFNDRSYNATSDMESQMYTTAAHVESFLNKHPDKPFILCEYTHAMGNSIGGMHKYIELEDRNPRYQGGFIWDYIDQALQVTAPNGKQRLTYGGDFGDRPTDRDFCGNGIVFADRTQTPKMQEVKFLYQDIRIKPDATGVTLENKFLFTNASKYLLRWELRRDGEQIQSGTLNAVDVPAGETHHYDLPLLSPVDSGEYVLHCGLFLRRPNKWADTEYELMHGNAVIANIEKQVPAADANYIISRGNVNIGARGAGFEMLFAITEGGLSSLRGSDGRELLSTAPSLSLFRAATSNDNGNGEWISEALWQVASLHGIGRFQSMDTTDGILRMHYTHELVLTGGAVIDVVYTVLGHGRVQVDMSYAGKQGLPDMAAFGISLRVPRQLCHASYYGYGPEENYCDRMHGAQLGLFTATPQSNLTPNLQPQECGNREGIRHLTLLDELGRGIRVDQVDTPLSISVLPYNAMELKTARHIDELADPTYTYLDIALCRKGVGGDDSWGAPVHPEYHIPTDKPMKLSFVLSVVK
ncbi:MAG: DUF4981 domain-containing protein [Clostridiales bacterium]|nr:DUF4981 domain-containing protein [Clostridiales bacterium]